MNIKPFSQSFLFVLLAFFSAATARAQDGLVSFQVFYDELSPYGTWINDFDYGNVWIPNVEPDFKPYATNGQWVLTDSGWTWVSEYVWGWAPFHYGRWHYDLSYGPMWVPDDKWGPGWVSWRAADRYFGWTPLEPGITLSVGYSMEYNVPIDKWSFVKKVDLVKVNISKYVISTTNNAEIIVNSEAIKNIDPDKRYNLGPLKEEVEKITGRPSAIVTISETSHPGQSFARGRLTLYRPYIKPKSMTGTQPMPKKLSTLKEIYTVKDRMADEILLASHSKRKKSKKQSYRTNGSGGDIVSGKPPPFQKGMVKPPVRSGQKKSKPSSTNNQLVIVQNKQQEPSPRAAPLTIHKVPTTPLPSKTLPVHSALQPLPTQLEIPLPIEDGTQHH